MYNSSEPMIYSVDGFKITIHGQGDHGTYPYNSIDPINIGVHIYLTLESLIAREANPSKACVLTIRNFTVGSVPNIIPDTAILQGTLRTNNNNSRENLIRRLKEVIHKTAKVFGGKAKVEMISEVPLLVCDSTMINEMVSYMEELSILNLTPVPDTTASASEDFVTVAEKVPSVYMYLLAGYMDERGGVPLHIIQRFNLMRMFVQ